MKNELKWRIGEKSINISELTDAQLKKGFIKAEKVYCEAHQTMFRMDDFIDAMEEEAENRGVSLTSFAEKTNNPKIKAFLTNETEVREKVTKD